MEVYTLRKQMGNRGCYSSIKFEAGFSPRDISELKIIYEAESKWEHACKAGICIFFDYFKRERNGQLTIKIIEIDSIPVDTNNLIVLFSVVKGLCEALDFNISKLEIDLLNETFILPEPRNRLKT